MHHFLELKIFENFPKCPEKFKHSYQICRSTAYWLKMVSDKIPLQNHHNHMFHPKGNDHHFGKNIALESLKAYNFISYIPITNRQFFYSSRSTSTVLKLKFNKVQSDWKFQTSNCVTPSGQRHLKPSDGNSTQRCEHWTFAHALSARSISLANLKRESRSRLKVKV